MKKKMRKKIRDKLWFLTFLALVVTLTIAPDILSHYYLKKIDLCRFHLAKIASFIDFMTSWGWIVYGLPIPIILPTTYFNMIFCIKLYGSLIVLFFSLYKKKVFVLVSLILLLVAFGSLEYERLTLNDFQTREELTMFLHNDHTDTMEYTGDFNCEDFSRTLIQGAKDTEYRLYFHATENHALCEAYIVTEMYGLK